VNKKRSLANFSVACLIALSVCRAPMDSVAQQVHWVGTWGCAPQLVEPGNLPPVPLSGKTLRQFVHISVGGDRLRVRLSNDYGKSAVSINSADVALAGDHNGVVNGNIDVSTEMPLTFNGAPSVNIPPGETVVSDPLDFDVPALTNLSISIYFGDVSATTINGHPGSRTTSFIQPGNALDAASMPTANKAAHWYFITGVDVWNRVSSGALIALGDSITDGRGSTTDGNDRWPDHLAQILHTNAATAGVAVVNMGIGGNGIFHGLGPAAVKRFDRDVLNQSGARWVIVFEGVNDIGGDSTGTIATNLIAAYTQFAGKAHERNLLVYGATITPFGGNRYYTASHEAARQRVNEWIRTNNLDDAVIDFDAIVRDPLTRTNLYSPYDSGDHLHLNPAGYRAMANGTDLRLFTSWQGQQTARKSF
jgi:lysophospholipase L1-like esterase